MRTNCQPKRLENGLARSVFGEALGRAIAVAIAFHGEALAVALDHHVDAEMSDAHLLLHAEARVGQALRHFAFQRRLRLQAIASAHRAKSGSGC